MKKTRYGTFQFRCLWREKVAHLNFMPQFSGPVASEPGTALAEMERRLQHDRYYSLMVESRLYSADPWPCADGSIPPVRLEGAVSAACPDAEVARWAASCSMESLRWQ
jgi:hypothetical protein